MFLSFFNNDDKAVVVKTKLDKADRQSKAEQRVIEKERRQKEKRKKS